MPRVTPPVERSGRGIWPVLITILVIVAGAVLALPQLPEGTARMAGWVAVVVATILAVWALRPSRRPPGRWRR